ncbi:hypothetical protein [Algibacter sp. L3A6]|uniref:hypothetical protein n=1 Tax=Algibacter sp. L3A6 TaxID=2686366 RepID=UPI00131D48C1|nr:hypothetical protein [Algibacter sp. L3A6]
MISLEFCWREPQAKQWERENYRESYLNHQFSKLDEPTKSVPLKLTKKEREEERKILDNKNFKLEEQKRKDRKIKKRALDEQRNLSEISRIKIEKKKRIEFEERKIQKIKNIRITDKSRIKEIIINAYGKNKRFEIEYENVNDEFSRRTISDIQITDEFISYGYSIGEHFTATCSKRGEETPFKTERIKSIKLL